MLTGTQFLSGRFFLDYEAGLIFLQVDRIILQTSAQFTQLTRNLPIDEGLEAGDSSVHGTSAFGLNFS